MKNGKLALLCAVASSALLVSSCSDEDFGYDDDYFRSKEYTDKFKEVFGDIDPDHNWSMAQNVKVNINVPGATGYEVRILSEAPTTRGTTLLYQNVMDGEQISANVDVIRGSRYVYAEVKSEFGNHLVDGYYEIDENGVVDVNKAGTAGTRAFSETAPGCSVYHTYLNRYNRVWNNGIATPTDANYRYDYGFQNNNPTYYLPADTKSKQVSPGWLIHCASGTNGDGGDRTSGTEYLSGPRTLALTNSKVENSIAISDALYFRNLNDQNHDQFNEAYVRYGDQGKRISIPSGNTVFHFALALRNNGAKNYNFKITIDKRRDEWDGTFWDEKKQETVTLDQSYNKGETNDGVIFKDVKVQLNDAEIGDYRVTVQLISENEWVQALCGGFWIESLGNTPITVEEMWGYLDYKDVRGGGVNWSGTNTLLNQNTKRYGWWSDVPNTFQYRTLDVRSMSNPSDGTIGQFHIINGEDGENIKVGTEIIKYKDMFPLYGMYKSTITGKWKGSPFREGDNHIDPFFSDGSYHQATDYEMQKDAQMITCGPCTDKNGAQHDGSVTVKMIGIGTGWGNDVGYFYYNKNDQSVYTTVNGERVLNLNKVCKVVIRKDMQNALTGDQASSIDDNGNMPNWGLGFMQYNRYVDGCAALDMTDEDAQGLINSNEFSDQTKDFYNSLKDNGTKRAIAKEATFTAPIYKLVYYTPTTNTYGNIVPNTSTATYIWPKDVVIGFFGIRTDANLGCELARVYTSSASAQRYTFNDIPRGSAFSYKGKNYIGLEDEIDYDNNDFLFEVEGVEPVNPDITPHDDPIQVNKYQTWIVACEDLGGVFDYDFNDLVWAVTKENVYSVADGGRSTETLTGINLYFQALAAGGTLEAVVQYNSKNDATDETGWSDLGEIHNLVKRTEGESKQDGSYKTPTNIQLNVYSSPSLSQIGNKIKLGDTIDPDLNDAVTIENILRHFRVIVEKHNGEKYVVGNNLQDKPDHNDSHGAGNGRTNAPQFILLPNGWAWPSEGVCITDVYKNFSDWAKNADQVNWYTTWRNSITGSYIENPLK